ncbi:NRDE family protein [Pleionea sediminis]|uniref:NRDE family protein n=1 Tax=Pleionea sediminis TaxID=2569479 RepID=UPI0011867FBB|nr:NRDE family protein [Pleionea sediminis]
MCLIAFAIAQHSEYPFVMLTNRDEFFDRPTASLKAWPTQPIIYAGQDLQAQGTWLGVNAHGRWAALTNIRHVTDTPGSQSRGGIVTDCLLYDGNLSDYFAQLKSQQTNYSGFNFVAGEISSILSREPVAHYFSNRQTDITSLASGTHALSNGLMQNEWPKMQKLRTHLTHLIEQNDLSSDQFFSLLENTEKSDLDRLPDTGLARSAEHRYSSLFVEPFNSSGRLYGTRSSCIIMADQNGQVHMIEKQHLPDEPSFKNIQFHLV